MTEEIIEGVRITITHDGNGYRILDRSGKVLARNCATKSLAVQIACAALEAMRKGAAK